MPLYVYKCTVCKEEVEILVRSKEDDCNQCAKCGEIMYRCLTPVAVHFKGSGFYTTDYKNKGSNSNTSPVTSPVTSSDSSSTSNLTGEGRMKSEHRTADKVIKE